MINLVENHISGHSADIKKYHKIVRETQSIIAAAKQNMDNE